MLPPLAVRTAGKISTTTWGKSIEVESFESHEMLQLSITSSAVHVFTTNAGQGKVIPRAAITMLEVSDPDASMTNLFQQGDFQHTFRVNWCKVQALLITSGVGLFFSLFLSVLIGNGWMLPSWSKFVSHFWPFLVALVVLPPLYFAGRAYWWEPRNYISLNSKSGSLVSIIAGGTTAARFYVSDSSWKELQHFVDDPCATSEYAKEIKRQADLVV